MSAKLQRKALWHLPNMTYVYRCSNQSDNHLVLFKEDAKTSLFPSCLQNVMIVFSSIDVNPHSRIITENGVSVTSQCISYCLNVSVIAMIILMTWHVKMNGMSWYCWNCIVSGLCRNILTVFLFLKTKKTLFSLLLWKQVSANFGSITTTFCQHLSTALNLRQTVEMTSPQTVLQSSLFQC